MKKIIILLCVFAMTLATACGNEAADSKPETDSRPETSVTDVITTPSENIEYVEPEEDLIDEIDDRIHFETLEELEEYIESVSNGHDYVYPQYDKEKYSFVSAWAYEGSKIFYLDLVDTDGNGVLFQSQVGYPRVFNSFEEFCESNRANMSLYFETVEAPELNGVFNSDIDNYSDFSFSGLNDEGREYYLGFGKTDKTDTSIEDLKKLLKDFKFTSSITGEEYEEPIVEINDSIHFETLEELEEYIASVSKGNDYVFPEYDKEKYSFDSAVAFDISKIFIMFLKDADGNSVSFGSQVGYSWHFSSFEEFCENNRVNMSLYFETVEAPELNGVFNSDIDNYNNFDFRGFNSEGIEYDLSLYKADKTDTSIEDLKELLKDFKI